MALDTKEPKGGPVEQKQITKSPKTGAFIYDDDAALTIINQDADRCDTYMTQMSFADQWYQADQLQQSPQSVAPYGANNNQSDDIPRFTLSNCISSIIPKMVGSLFYETPSFLLRPRPNVDQDLILAKTALMETQLDEMRFQREVKLGFDQCALIGTGIYKWGWCEYSEDRKQYVRAEEPSTIKTPFSTHTIATEASEEFDVKYVTHKTTRPWFKWCDTRRVLVDTKLNVGDITKADFVIYRDYTDYCGLEKLRQLPGYNIPSEAECQALFFPPEKKQASPDNSAITIPQNLRAWIAHSTPKNEDSSADPYLHPIEILERWSKDHLMVSIQHGSASILIFNDENPYHKIPFYSFNWRDIQDSFYGMGLGRLIGNDQRMEQGALNSALKIARYSTKPMMLRKAGNNAPTQQIRQTLMGIYDVTDDVDKAFKFMELPKVPPEVWQIIQNASAQASKTSGANEQFGMGAGAAGIQTTGARSATGAAGVIAANATRLDGPLGTFVTQVFEPWLWQMDELNNDYLPASALQDMVDQQMEKDITIDHIKFRNVSSKIKFEVLAGTKLGPKKEMTQFLPFMMQLFNNPPFVQALVDAGYTFDANNIFKMFADMAGWKYSQKFVIKMDPVTAKRHQANMPAALQQQKAQAQQALENQKFQQDRTLQEEGQLGKAGGEITRTVIEHAMDNEALQGEAGEGGGFLGTNPQ